MGRYLIYCFQVMISLYVVYIPPTPPPHPPIYPFPGKMLHKPLSRVVFPDAQQLCFQIALCNCIFISRRAAQTQSSEVERIAGRCTRSPPPHSHPPTHPPPSSEGRAASFSVFSFVCLYKASSIMQRPLTPLPYAGELRFSFHCCGVVVFFRAAYSCCYRCNQKKPRRHQQRPLENCKNE